MHEPIRGISSMAVRAVLASLAERYERETGRRVLLASAGGVDVARRVRESEPFDFVVLAADAMERLAVSGHVLPETRADIACSPMAVAVPAGTAHPAIGSEAALREAILRAAHIGYSTGPSGDHLLRLLERWGVAETLRPRLVQAPAGTPVGALIAGGAAALGFQQLSELIDVPGIEIVGRLPAGAQAITLFSVARCAVSRQAQAVGDFLAFISSGNVDSLKREHGMEPA